jgi:polyphosphate kinase
MTPSEPIDPGSAGPSVPPVPPLPPADEPSLWLNRELEQVEFNARVLAQAEDPDVPLLERLRFLTIASSNFDEFFEVRVGGMKQRLAAGSNKAGPDAMPPGELMGRISDRVHELVEEQYRVLNEELLPQLAAEGVRLLRRSEWTDAQHTWLREWFEEQVVPLVSPVALDPAHPFPSIINKALAFVVALDGKDAFGRTASLAVLQVPRVLPRILKLPAHIATGPWDFTLISSVIHQFVGDLFPGMTLRSCHQFRITRNSDLWVDEEEMEDLMDALKGELPGRRYGDAVRLEVADNCPPETSAQLLRHAGLEERDLYRVNGPVNMYRLAFLIGHVDRDDLKWPPFTPGAPLRREPTRSIFEIVRERDLLLHHPYESFNPVIELLQEAARDPDVLAIKQTLYRTGADSPVVEALVEAALNGKEVTCVVELMARFDEAANIAGASRLQDAGANVVYGVVGYKTHAKMLMVVRRDEEGSLRRFTHLGTGNYHHITSKLYTDFGWITADPEIGADVHQVFMQLTSVGQGPTLRKLLQSPFTLLPTMLALIEFEAAEARAGRPARIVARTNALTDVGVMHKLYEASRAGVQIDLIIRGVCCLRPGVPNLSENIRVRSVVGRFLEHSRAYWFHHGGEERVYLSSADWMDRNLHRRVEVAFPIEEPALRRRVIEEGLLPYLADNRQAWEMTSDGSYVPVPEGEAPMIAQRMLLERLAELGRAPGIADTQRRRKSDRKKKKRKKKD